MNLVFKNLNEEGDPNDEYLYKDVRVNKGTIFGLDFSNRGMLLNYDLSKGITDLAEDAPAHEGITTYPEFGLGNNGIIPELTEKRGLPLIYAGNQPAEYTSGIRLQGVGSYLFEKRPRTLYIIWVGWDLSLTEGSKPTRAIRLGQSTGSLLHALTVNFASTIGSPALSVSIAGKSGTGNITVNGNNSSQIALEYVGENEPNRYWINGVYQGEGSASEGTFESPVGDDILAIGGLFPSSSDFNNGIIYNSFLHDLDAAGMSAEALVEQDYNYVNELGSFEGTGCKRPYANV